MAGVIGTRFQLKVHQRVMIERLVSDVRLRAWVFIAATLQAPSPECLLPMTFTQGVGGMYWVLHRWRSCVCDVIFPRLGWHLSGVNVILTTLLLFTDYLWVLVHICVVVRMRIPSHVTFAHAHWKVAVNSTWLWGSSVWLTSSSLPVITIRKCQQLLCELYK